MTRSFFILLLIGCLSIPLFSENSFLRFGTSSAIAMQTEKTQPESFRGVRKTAKKGQFILNSTSAKETKNGKVSVVLEFSTPLDPRSVSFKTVKINDRPLSENTPVSFNKEGTKCCFCLGKEEMPVKINLYEISSFDGKKLFPLSTYVKLEPSDE